MIFSNSAVMANQRKLVWLSRKTNIFDTTGISDATALDHHKSLRLFRDDEG
jgi:hypothetical protein